MHQHFTVSVFIKPCVIENSIAFATMLTENRIVTDILGGDYKPRSRGFDNELPLGRPVELEITYTDTAMWVRVDGELRCLTEKEAYQKALKRKEFPDVFADGFEIAVSCDKGAELTIFDLQATEYGSCPPETPAREEVRPLLYPQGGLCPGPTSTLEECVQALPQALRTELLRTDEYLRSDCKPEMKFTRKIEGRFPCCKITYIAPQKLSYRVLISGSYIRHSIGWLWTREDRKGSDRTIEALQRLAQSDPDAAAELFHMMKECCGCSKTPAFCMNYSPYDFNGQTKISCQGRFHFHGKTKDFEVVRRFAGACREMLRSI